MRAGLGAEGQWYIARGVVAGIILLFLLHACVAKIVDDLSMNVIAKLRYFYLILSGTTDMD